MVYLVCYDISSDRLRDRMAKRLLDFGSRVQESVFECVLNDPLYARMMAQLTEIPLGESDRVRVYRLCANCIQQVQIYGACGATEESDFHVV
jgi:CRISPR-associated protein Cas2